MDARRLLVSGRVQGVGYRFWTVRVATELGLRGWVRNLHDGRVEILAAGKPEALDMLAERCRSGPPAARVESVETTPESAANLPSGFTERPIV